MKSSKIFKTARKWLLAIVILLMAVFVFSGRNASAASTLRNLKLNNRWVYGTLLKGHTSETRYYSFTVQGDGWVHIEVQDYGVIGHSWSSKNMLTKIKLISSNPSARYYYTYLSGASARNPKTMKKSFALSRGTYFIAVYDDNNIWNYNRRFRIRGRFTAADSNDTEPNNLFSSAQSVSAGSSVTGFLTFTDRQDYYKITLPRSATVTIRVTSYIERARLSVYGSDRKRIRTFICSRGRRASVKSFRKTIKLNAGVYYLEFFGSHQYNRQKYHGKYTFRWYYSGSTSSLNNTGKVLKVRLKKTSYVYSGKLIRPAIRYVKAGNTKIRTCTVSWTNNRKVGIARVTVKGTGKYAGWTGSATFKIVPAKQRLLSYGLTADRKGVYLTWRKDSQATGYEIQYGRQISFRGAPMVRTGQKTNRLRFSNLKKNVSYYFRFRSYRRIGSRVLYGPWSSVYKVNVR